jgi:hypothetical protein
MHFPEYPGPHRFQGAGDDIDDSIARDWDVEYSLSDDEAVGTVDALVRPGATRHIETAARAKHFRELSEELRTARAADEADTKRLRTLVFLEPSYYSDTFGTERFGLGHPADTYVGSIVVYGKGFDEPRFEDDEIPVIYDTFITWGDIATTKRRRPVTLAIH